MKKCESCRHWKTDYYLSKSKAIGYCIAAEEDESIEFPSSAMMYIKIEGRNFEASASLVTRKDFFCSAYIKQPLRKTIKDAIDAAGLGYLDIEGDDTGFSLRHDTDDNTAKENYADALNRIDEIRMSLLPINLDVEVSEMTDHDTILYNVITEKL